MNFFRLTSSADKSLLYDRIDTIRESLNIDIEQYPLNFCEHLEKENDLIEIVYKPFSTPGSWGFIIKNRAPYKSVVLLNKNLKAKDINFALAHEIVHLFCHTENELFSGNKKSKPLEWQANEGAAELLLPYKFFIPDFLTSLEEYKSTSTAVIKTAEAYSVDEIVVRYRYANLKKEFEQVTNGTEINKIQLK